jgi:hypothetical protein
MGDPVYERSDDGNAARKRFMPKADGGGFGAGAVRLAALSTLGVSAEAVLVLTHRRSPLFGLPEVLVSLEEGRAGEGFVLQTRVVRGAMVAGARKCVVVLVRAEICDVCVELILGSLVLTRRVAMFGDEGLAKIEVVVVDL